MSKFAKTMTAAGAVITMLLIACAIGLFSPTAQAADSEPGISTQMSQEGATTIKGGALVGWNGWEYTPEGATVPVKVNFVENEDGSGTWYALTEEGIDGKTSGTVTKDEVGKSVVKVADGSTSLVDNVTYSSLNTSQEYTLIGNLAAKFSDGSYGIVLSVDRKAQSASPAADTDGEGNSGSAGDGNTSNGNTGDDNSNTAGSENENTNGNTADNENSNENHNSASNENANGNAASNENSNENTNGNTNENSNENADADKAPEALDLGTVTYYNPVDKKVYTRPITNGKAVPVEVKDVKVELDEESGMPLGAITSAVKFVPSAPSASVKNVFSSFDATDMWGWTFVAFERLYAGDPANSTDTDKDDNAANENTNANTGENENVNSNENETENGGNIDESGNDTRLVADGTLANVLVALDGGSQNVNVYTFPTPLAADSDPTETEALADWQKSINGGLQGTKTESLQHEIVIYTDPAYKEGGDKVSSIPADQNYMTADPDDVPELEGASAGDVIIWTNTGGSNPVDAYISNIQSVNYTVDGTTTTYKNYTLKLFPVPADNGSGGIEYSKGDDDVVVSYKGAAAGYHIGNYGYTEINGKEYPFKLVGIHASGTNWTYTYQVYDFAGGAYTTTTTSTPYTNVIGNIYCDDAARPDWTTSTGVTRYTLPYSASMLDGTTAPPAAETVTITFDANGGSTVASMTGTAGDAIANQQIGTTTRDGYTFDGWWTANGTVDGEWGEAASAENADGTYNVKLAVYPDTNVTYYAKWVRNDDVNGDGNNNNENGNSNTGDNENSNTGNNENTNGNENAGGNENENTNDNTGSNENENDNANEGGNTGSELKTGLVANHENPDDLAQTIFFMSIEDAAAAAAEYSSPTDGTYNGAMDGTMSQMGDTIGWIIGLIAIAGCVCGGVYLIRRGRE